MLIEVAISDFLSNKRNYRGYKKPTIETLLQSEKPYSLLTIYGRGELNPDDLKKSIPESVKAYPNHKDSAIDIYKKFITFIGKKYILKVEIIFPPIPVSVTLERIMFIAKYLQDPNHRIEDLQDILWVGQRTIEEDLAKLRGNNDGPIQICGKKFVIEEMERRNGNVTMASTAHPIFLTSNLTQIIVTLKGLKLMSRDSAFKVYADEMAKSIWDQLSDYAKERILFVIEHRLPDEVDWYRSMEDRHNRSFISEYMCRNTQGAGCVTDCIKNGKACFIEYQAEDDTIQFFDNCKVEDYDGETISILHNGQKLVLLGDRILRSSYTLEELI